MKDNQKARWSGVALAAPVFTVGGLLLGAVIHQVFPESLPIGEVAHAREVMVQLLTGLTFAFWVGLSIFSVSYSLLLPWHEKPAGRYLMGSLMALWGLTSTGLARRVGLNDLADITATLVYLFGLGAVILGLALLLAPIFRARKAAKGDGGTSAATENGG